MSKYDPTGDSPEAQYTQHISTVAGLLNAANTSFSTPEGYIAGLTALQSRLKEAHRTLGTDAQWDHHEQATRALNRVYMDSRGMGPQHFFPMNNMLISLQHIQTAYKPRNA